jgi:exonuclease I
VLNLMLAATTLYPSVVRSGFEPDGRPTHRLGAITAANGIVSRKAHDAAADVDAMLGLCRLVRAGAPELWSTFLRFSAKAAVIDFVRDEDAFAYFDYFGRPQVMHFLTRVGICPNDANAHYCLDLACDIVGSDTEFMASLTRAATSLEPIYPPSEHVEDQIYGGNFISDADAELCRDFHSLPWDARPTLIGRFADGRLRRLGKRLIYFESPHLFEQAERRVIEDDISARRRGDGKYATAPWMTISRALSELGSIEGGATDFFKMGFLNLR